MVAGQRQWIATTNCAGCPGGPQIALRIAPCSPPRQKCLMRWDGPSRRAFLCGLTPNRNSLSRLWPVQISDHSPFTFSSPRSRNCRNPRPCLIWPNTAPQFASAKRSAADPAWSVTSVASGPWETNCWVCVLGARVANPAVAGLLRRDERVHAQSIELVDCLCRVIASIGGYFPGDCTDVVDGLLHHRRSLLLIRSLVGGPRRHDHLA